MDVADGTRVTTSAVAVRRLQRLLTVRCQLAQWLLAPSCVSECERRCDQELSGGWFELGAMVGRAESGRERHGNSGRTWLAELKQSFRQPLSRLLHQYTGAVA